MPTQFIIFRTQVRLYTTADRLLRYYLLLHTLACKCGVPCATEQAHKQALQIFNSRTFASDILASLIS